MDRKLENDFDSASCSWRSSWVKIMGQKTNNFVNRSKSLNENKIALLTNFPIEKLSNVGCPKVLDASCAQVIRHEVAGNLHATSPTIKKN